MKRTTYSCWTRIVGVVFATVTLAAAPLGAKTQQDVKVNRTLCERTLVNGKTTDLFLRKGNGGSLFLYVASASGRLSIYDVSKPAEPRELNTLPLSSNKLSFQIRPVSDRVAVAAEALDASQSLTVLDLVNAPTVEIARKLKNVDAYTIDAETNTLFVAQRGKLFVMQFDHPITGEAEIWEQSYDAR